VSRTALHRAVLFRAQALRNNPYFLTLGPTSNNARMAKRPSVQPSLASLNSEEPISQDLGKSSPPLDLRKARTVSMEAIWVRIPRCCNVFTIL
jgi:hypothetical protein